MKRRHLAIVGCGDIGERVAGLLAGESWRVTGLRRDPSRLPRGVDGVAVDYAEPDSLGILASLAPDYLLLTLKPQGRDTAAYQAGFEVATAAVLEGLDQHRPRGILMVSSTRVYAENAGGWVDEDSLLNISDPSAHAIIRAERRLLEDAGTPVCVVRSAGLYGGEAPRLLRRVADGEFTAATPLRYTNRIHRDDLAGLLVHLLHRREAAQPWPPVINAVDDAPVSQQAVERWLAQSLGMEAPRELAIGGQAVGGRRNSGAQTQGKRCRNRALHACGYDLLHPDFRSGYLEAMRA